MSATDQEYRIVMVCTGNICRSPMAERLLKHLLPANLKSCVSVSSAGTSALHGHQAADHAVTAMAQLGIDIRNHRARQLNSNIVQQTDLILAMENSHLQIITRAGNWSKTQARLLTEFGPPNRAPDIEDPYGKPLKAYQACLATLRPCIEGVIAWLSEHPLSQCQKESQSQKATFWHPSKPTKS